MILQKAFLYHRRCLTTAVVETLIEKQCQKDMAIFTRYIKQSFPISFKRECQIEYTWDLIISHFDRQKHKHVKNQTSCF